MTNLRRYSFPTKLEEKIWKELEKLGCDPDAISRIKECIQRLSDHFIAQKAKSPLSERWAQVAYLAYYFPLNYLRAQAVCDEAVKVRFFQGLESAVDVGSGLGSLTANLLEVKTDWLKLESTDISSEAIEIQKRLLPETTKNIKFSRQDELLPKQKFDLACFSYSWNEFSELEKNSFLDRSTDFEAVMFIEPSTQLHSRNLMRLRQTLIEKGFFAWAPCTHQQDCPLLIHSKTDWCHDRIAIDKTKWQASIEKGLAFKNETLTFSYLLMRKTKPSREKEHQGFEFARVIGDELVEKGKNRQAVCRSSEREFFSWFPQRLKHNILSFIHGEKLLLQNTTVKKSNELRITQENVIKSSK